MKKKYVSIKVETLIYLMASDLLRTLLSDRLIVGGTDHDDEVFEYPKALLSDYRNAIDE
jgi:hypothetical protein